MTQLRRGVVLPLTDEQVIARARYLAGQAPMSSLDPFVRKMGPVELTSWGYKVEGGAPIFVPDLFYRLNGKGDGLPPYNGGKDPRAPDPADRWTKPGHEFTNRTVDCSGGDSWMHGHDRFLAEFRFYQDTIMSEGRIFRGGWANTDSKIDDARKPLKPGQVRCYVEIPRPEPACIVVCKSGSPGHAVGHEGTVTAVHVLEWDPKERECWDALDVVDCAMRTPHRANKMTTGRGWFGTGALFLRSVVRRLGEGA